MNILFLKAQPLKESAAAARAAEPVLRPTMAMMGSYTDQYQTGDQQPPGYCYPGPPSGSLYSQSPAGDYSYQRSLPPSSVSRAGHLLVAPVQSRSGGAADIQYPTMPDFSLEVVDLKSYF